MTLKAVLNLFLLPKNTTIIKFKILLMMIARAGVVAGQPAPEDRCPLSRRASLP